MHCNGQHDVRIAKEDQDVEMEHLICAACAWDDWQDGDEDPEGGYYPPATEKEYQAHRERWLAEWPMNP